MSNAKGKIYLATLSPFSDRSAVFTDRASFGTTLSVLNEQANNPSYRACRAITYPQLRGVFDNIGRFEADPPVCQVFIFTDLNVPTESREPRCRQE